MAMVFALAMALAKAMASALAISMVKAMEMALATELALATAKETTLICFAKNIFCSYKIQKKKLTFLAIYRA